MFTQPLYFDYAATTPVDKSVAAEMTKCLTFEGNFGNPASRAHFYGWQAEQVVEAARIHVAKLINADAREIVFTSGATEANNLAIKGCLEKSQSVDGELEQNHQQDHHQQDNSHVAKNHIVTSQIEHKAVLDACKALEQHSVNVTYVAPQTSGITRVDDIANAITPQTALVSIMLVNNELGVINDIAAIGQLCQARGCLLHVDASQACGKVAIDVHALHIDFLSLSAHKMYGPKGIGALFVKRSPKTVINAQIHGGGHERGMRSGTLPTHQLAGLGECSRIAAEQLDTDNAHYKALHAHFLTLMQPLSGWRVNAQSAPRVDNIINIAIEQVDGEVLLTLLDDIALSTGSACTSASVEPSYVLSAIGLPRALAHSSFRISFGRYTTKDDVTTLVEKIHQGVNTLRSSAA